MQPALISGHQLTGRHGAIADLGVVRPDLLPASREVAGAIGAKTKVADIVLPDAARLTGIVRWPDDTPIARVRIGARAVNGNVLEVSANTGIARNFSEPTPNVARTPLTTRGRRR